jgi:hypothetical protein
VIKQPEPLNISSYSRILIFKKQFNKMIETTMNPNLKTNADFGAKYTPVNKTKAGFFLTTLLTLAIGGPLGVFALEARLSAEAGISHHECYDGVDYTVYYAREKIEYLENNSRKLFKQISIDIYQNYIDERTK